jgi:hypothetical protein
MSHQRDTLVSVLSCAQQKTCHLKFFHSSVYCSFTWHCWHRIFFYKMCYDETVLYSLKTIKRTTFGQKVANDAENFLL